MVKEAIIIALAFVGLVVGAGFASGQEVLQYFVSFGLNGFIGMVIAGIIVTIAGAVFLELGSYYLADEHYTVFANTQHPLVSRFLDISTLITLFSLGFVMLAGAGANFNQQFGWPTWIGAVIMVALVVVTGFMDIDKVTRVISAVTPLIIIAVIVAGVITLRHMPPNVDGLNELATQQKHPNGVFNNWVLSALNYAGLNLIVGVSMILVIGGTYFRTREAGFGGIMGGLIFSLMLGTLGIVIFLNLEAVKDSPMPLLAVYNQLNGGLGVAVAVVIYLMIYNTCVGMFYSLARRLAAGNEKRFLPIYLISVAVGFGLSFFGFTKLVSNVYPILGYVGVIMVVVLTISWAKHRPMITQEINRRERLTEIAEGAMTDGKGLTRSERAEVKTLVSESEHEDNDLWDRVQEEVEKTSEE